MKKFGCNTRAFQPSARLVHRALIRETLGRWRSTFYPLLRFSPHPPRASSSIPRGPTSTKTLDDDVPSKFPSTRGRIEKSMARKAGEQRCKAHLCCRPARKTLKNAVMTHCPRIARDNYTPLRPTRYSLFFRSRPRTEARCGRSRYAKACASARRFIVDYSCRFSVIHRGRSARLTAASLLRNISRISIR